MCEYSFISIVLQRRREGLDPVEDYREVIRARAADGWEFVQAISFESASEPHIDFVFSKKVGN